MAKKPSARKTKWLKDLTSPLEDVVMDAIGGIAKNGDVSMVKPLLQTLRNSDSAKIRATILSTLNDVKDEKLGDELFGTLNTLGFEDLNAAIVSVLWNASVPLTGHLERLVDIACSGGFEEQFEVLTALDHFEGEFNEEEVLDSLVNMRSYFKTATEKTEVQRQILQKLQIFERFD